MQLAAETYDTVYARTELRYQLALADGVSAATASLRCSGFVAPDEPRRVAAAMRRHLSGCHSGVLVDLGCGAGLFGAQVAANLGFQLTGFDFSGSAIRLARAYVPGGVFSVATFDRLPLRDACAAGVMSHDALYLAATDAALSEIARVLCRRAPMIVSTYVSSKLQTWSLVTWQEKLHEHGLLLRSVSDDTRRWRRLMQRKHRARWNKRHELISALGPDVAPEIAVSGRMIGADCESSFIAATSRFLIIATRR
ncbi:MAG TPA: class I SAM-dependent methyltransferase [Thermoanaerobaculia bacterium]|nr:class I SAM-dependent methyltransferase [Thermoanaerobaculia bacterium]